MARKNEFYERRKAIRDSYSSERRIKSSSYRHKYKGRFNALDEGINYFHRYQVNSITELEKGIRDNLRKNGVYKITIVSEGQSFSYVGSSVGYPTASGGIGVRWAEHMEDINTSLGLFRQVNNSSALPFFPTQFVHQAAAAVLFSGRGQVYFEILSLVKAEWINAEERTMMDREGTMIEKTGLNIREEKHRYRWSTFNNFVVGERSFRITKTWERLLVAAVRQLIEVQGIRTTGGIFTALLRARVFPPEIFGNSENLIFIQRNLSAFMKSIHSISDGIARGILYARSDADALIKRHEIVRNHYNSVRVANELDLAYGNYANTIIFNDKDKRFKTGHYVKSKATLEQIIDAQALGLTFGELFTKAEVVDLIDMNKETAARPRDAKERFEYYNNMKEKTLSSLLGKKIKIGK